MKKVIFVVWSLLLTWELTSCRDKVIVVSNAGPIQFWINGVETFNDTQVCSIEPVFFCQKFQCDDDIRIQFRSDNNYDANYDLVFYDISDDTFASELERIRFIQIANDVFELHFTFGAYLCNQEIRLRIESTPPTIINYPAFGQLAGSGTWVRDIPNYGVSTISLNPAATPYTSRKVYFPFNAAPGTYVISGNTVSNSDGTMRGYFLDASFNVIGTDAAAAALSSGLASGGNPITVTQPIYYVAFDVNVTTSSPINGHDVTFNVIVTSSTITIEAKSDCISVNEDQCENCTELITYSNSNSFDDVDYMDASPNIEFNLRIEAVFFEEEFPDEYESIDLSNSEIVQLSSEVKHKKLLDVGWMPFHMIQKLQLVLSHDNVIIQGKNWIKGDGMTKIQGNKRYPLRRTSFLLTDKDFIKRNIL